MPRKQPSYHRLSPECADEIARRLDRLEGLIECDRPFETTDWELFVGILLPEYYADPEKADRLPSDLTPGTEAKASLLYQRSLCQYSLWHAADAADFPDDLRELLVPIYMDGTRRKNWRRRTAAAPSRPLPEKKPTPRPKRHWHQGMLRFDDVEETAASREYDPSEWKRKGDDDLDGETNARRHRVAAGV